MKDIPIKLGTTMAISTTVPMSHHHFFSQIIINQGWLLSLSTDDRFCASIPPPHSCRDIKVYDEGGGGGEIFLGEKYYSSHVYITTWGTVVLLVSVEGFSTFLRFSKSNTFLPIRHMFLGPIPKIWQIRQQRQIAGTLKIIFFFWKFTETFLIH